MNANVKINNPAKISTKPDIRRSYANVWESKSINGSITKYGVIPKSDTKNIANIGDAIEAAYKEGEANLKGNSKSAPDIVNADRNPLLICSKVYSDMYSRASVNFYAFNSSRNKDSARGFNNLQKIFDGGLLVARLAQSLILHLMKMKIFLIKGSSTLEMLQTIIVVILLTIRLLFNVVFLIITIQNFINDRKHEIREQKNTKCDI